MRYPPRLVLAASVAGMVAASSGAVLLMPGPTADAVPLPDVAEVQTPQDTAPDTAPDAAPDTAPVAPAAAPGPVVTGEQIAALAVAPARDRVEALIAAKKKAEAEKAAAAEKTRAPRSGSDSERWEKLRDSIHDACDDGRIRGQICRSG